MRTDNGRSTCSRGPAFVLAFVALWLGACADPQSKVIVGSGQMLERVTATGPIEQLKITLPFESVVYQGKPGQITIRGEDNLVAQIVVAQIVVAKDASSAWKVSAARDLLFEQHQDLRIEVPYTGMLAISVDSDVVRFADDPSKVWQRSMK